MGTSVQIQNTGKNCFSLTFLFRLDAHMGCQIEDTQQEQEQLTIEGDEPYTVIWFYLSIFNQVIELFSRMPRLLIMLLVVFCCCTVFFHQLATQGVEILSKLLVGQNHTDQNKIRHSDMKHTFQSK